MPEQNTRIVVTGTPRADKEFEVLMQERKEGDRVQKKQQREEEKATSQLKRDLAD